MLHLLAAVVTPPTSATPPDLTAPETVQQAVGVAPDRLIQLAETYGVPVIKAIFILIIGWIIAGWLSKLASTTCRKANLDETLARFLGNIVRWFVIAAVAITCLASFGVQVASLVAVLGSVGVAIGLALQGSLSHIASGVMLLIFRPFKVGDFVTAGGQTGIIHEIGLFSTLLDTADNRRIIVPNGAIVSGVITNATYHPQRVADVTVQVDAGVSVEAARLALSQAAAAVAGRDASKPPAIGLAAMGATNAFNVSIWCATGELDAVRERLMIALNSTIAAKGMGPAAPVTLVKNV